MPKYQNNGEVVVEAPQDWLIRWDATDASGIGYLTDEATNDVDEWESQVGPEGIGPLTFYDNSVSTNWPEYIRDADDLPCIHFQADGSLHISSVQAQNYTLWERLDDSSDFTLFVVGMQNDTSSASTQYFWQGVNKQWWSNVGTDSSLDLYHSGAYRSSTNGWESRRFIASARNKHNGTNDNDSECWVGRDSLYSVTGAADSLYFGGNTMTIGSWGGGATSSFDSDCNIYEVRIYGRTLTSGEHRAVVDELSAKWDTCNNDDVVGNATFTEPLNSFPQDYTDRWDATTSRGMEFTTDEATGDLESWNGQGTNGLTLTRSLGSTGDITWTPGNVHIAASTYLKDLNTYLDDQDKSVFVAGEQVGGAEYGGLFFGPGMYALLGGDSATANKLARKYYGGAWTSVDSTNDLEDTPIVLGAAFDRTSAGVYDVDWYVGTTKTTSASIPITPIATTGFGYHATGQFSEMNIYEAIIYDRTLSETEANEVIDYLSHKWDAWNEDAAAETISPHVSNVRSWTSDKPDPKGEALTELSPVNHTITKMLDDDVPVISGTQDADDRLPASLANLQVWFRSDHTGGMTFATGDATSGGTVSSWVDITGSFTLDTTTSGDSAVDFAPRGGVKGGHPSIAGGTSASPKSLESTANPTVDTTTGQQRLYWAVGTFGSADKDSCFGTPYGDLLAPLTYSGFNGDMVDEPAVSYMGNPSGSGRDFSIASGGPQADDGRIHIFVWRTTSNGASDIDVESWYAGLKLPDRNSTSALYNSGKPLVVGALANSSYDAEAGDMLEMGAAHATTTSVQTYSDATVEDLIQYLCNRYDVDYMPAETPVTIGCWSRQTSVLSQTDCCLWYEPGNMTPSGWALHPTCAAFHTTPDNFILEPGAIAGAEEMELNTRIGHTALESVEAMEHHMEAATSYSSTETTDFPADTLGMSTFMVCQLHTEGSTVYGGGAIGNQPCQLRFSGSVASDLIAYGGETGAVHSNHVDHPVICGASYAYNDDGTGTLGYPGSTNGSPGCYFYINDDTMISLDTATSTSMSVYSFVNWDGLDGHVDCSEIVTFKHPLTIEEVTELKKYFRFKYDHAFDD